MVRVVLAIFFGVAFVHPLVTRSRKKPFGLVFFLLSSTFHSTDKKFNVIDFYQFKPNLPKNRLSGQSRHCVF